MEKTQEIWETLQKKRWKVLIASCFVIFCNGSLYAWSAFAGPMANYLSQCTGGEITSLAIVFTMANAVGPVTMIGGGYINDKLGPKGVLLAGGLLFGAGMIGSGFAKSVGMLIASYSLGVGLGGGLIYGTVTSNAVKFFPDKGGMVGGIITACYGTSSIIIPPIATWLAENYGVTTAFRVIGGAMLCIICMAAFVIEPYPKGTQKDETMEGEYTCLEMLRHPTFYLMLLTLTCGAFAGMMIISQASQIAQGMMGFSVQAATLVVSGLALFNTLGRLTSGVLSDGLGASKTLKLCFLGSLAAGLLLFFCKENTAALFCAGLAVVGFCFGGIMGIYPGFTAKQFGRRNNSMNYGVMFVGFALAGLLGPWIMNTVVRMTGRYQPAFLASASLAMAGIGLLCWFDAMTKE